MIAQESGKPLVQPEIPFRESPAVSGTQVMFVFSVTLLLLGALWFAAQYARRKGWLDKWLSKTGGGPHSPAIRVLSSRRVSRSTTLYTVDDGEDRYLLVESKANVNLVKVGPRNGLIANQGGNDE